VITECACKLFYLEIYLPQVFLFCFVFHIAMLYWDFCYSRWPA